MICISDDSSPKYWTFEKEHEQKWFGSMLFHVCSVGVSSIAAESETEVRIDRMECVELDACEGVYVFANCISFWVPYNILRRPISSHVFWCACCILIYYEISSRNLDNRIWPFVDSVWSSVPHSWTIVCTLSERIPHICTSWMFYPWFCLCYAIWLNASSTCIYWRRFCHNPNNIFSSSIFYSGYAMCCSL